MALLKANVDINWPVCFEHAFEALYPCLKEVKNKLIQKKKKKTSKHG